MMVSSRVKSKLTGIENNDFLWLEEKNDKKKKRFAAEKTITYYRGFKLNSLTIYEGDCVLINVGADFGDLSDKFDIARILECYHDEKEDTKGCIKVQWFTPVDKIRKRHLKYLPPGLPPLEGDLEVVKDLWAYEVTLDPETVSALCCVMEVCASVAPDTVERPPNAVGPMYVCRFTYVKSNPWIIPLNKDDIYEENTDKSIFALREILNSLKNGTVPLNNLKDGYRIEDSTSKQSSNPERGFSSKVNSVERTGIPEEKRRVKRKLLDHDEEQENLSKKSRKGRGSPVTWKENKAMSSPRRERKTLTEIEINSNFKSPNEGSKIENVKKNGQCAGLQMMEMSDLLSDEDNKRKARSTRCRSKKMGNVRKNVRQTRILKSYIVSSEEEEEEEEEEEDYRHTSDIKRPPGKNVTKIVESENEIILSSKRISKPSEKLKNSYMKKNSSLDDSKLTPVKEITPKKRGKVEEKTFKSITKPKHKTDSGSHVKEKYETSVTPVKRGKNVKYFKDTPNRTPSRSNKKTTFSKLPDRNTPVSKYRTEFEQARAQLHVSAVPSFLPCREDEFQQIYSFVEGKLLDSTGGCMYVSGVPGTGKTATVREVVRLLHECENEGMVAPFQFLEVNAMKLTKPHQLWVQIWEGLTTQRVTADHAYSLFEKLLASSSRPKRKSIFLLLDELDLLWTRKQDVMYNLFDLSSRIDSRLIVVTIANTMDLPERMMISRVSSRLGLTRMTFHPYTFKQLQEIIASRLMGMKAFDPDAVQLVARKVAAVSGDARRALDVCRRATELAEQKKMELILSPIKSPKKLNVLVGMCHVSEAIEEMFSSPKITAIRLSSQMDKYILQAVLMEFTRTGIEEAVLIRVLEHLQSICSLEGISSPSSSDTLKLINGLSSQRILFTEHSRLDLLLRIRLNISTDDVSYALTH